MKLLCFIKSLFMENRKFKKQIEALTEEVSEINKDVNDAVAKVKATEKKIKEKFDDLDEAATKATLKIKKARAKKDS